MQTKREEMAKRHAEERERLESEEQIADAIAKLGLPEPERIHAYLLYGRVGSAKYKADTIEALAQQMRAIGERCAIVPAYQWRDGCLSFKPAPYVDRLPDEKLDRVELTPASGLMLKIEAASYSRRVVVEYTIDLPGVGLLEIEHETPIGLWCRALTVSPRYVRYGRNEEHKRIDGWLLNWRKERLYMVFGGDGATPLAEAGQEIRWTGGGDKQEPNPFTLWWYDLSEDRPPLANFAAAFEKANQP